MFDFTYYTPTRVIFGKEAVDRTAEAVKSAGGTRVLLHYGGQSAVKSGLIGRLETLSDMEKALSGSGEQGASLSGMVRCAQIENFVGQRGMQEGLSG